jgi:hypothetical protein
VASKGLDLPQALASFQPPGDHTLPDHRWRKSLCWNYWPQGFN